MRETVPYSCRAAFGRGFDVLPSAYSCPTGTVTLLECLDSQRELEGSAQFRHLSRIPVSRLLNWDPPCGNAPTSLERFPAIVSHRQADLARVQSRCERLPSHPGMGDARWSRSPAGNGTASFRQPAVAVRYAPIYPRFGLNPLRLPKPSTYQWRGR